MIYATGHLSGAHINPAVTLAFTATRHFPLRDAAAYIPAQLLGAVGGAVVLRLAWNGTPADLGATVPTVGAGSAFIYELILTALPDVRDRGRRDRHSRCRRRRRRSPSARRLASMHSSAGRVTGASMNPARSFGPALVADQWHDFWIYVVRPGRRSAARCACLPGGPRSHYAPAKPQRSVERRPACTSTVVTTAAVATTAASTALPPAGGPYGASRAALLRRCTLRRPGGAVSRVGINGRASLSAACLEDASTCGCLSSNESLAIEFGFVYSAPPEDSTTRCIEHHPPNSSSATQPRLRRGGRSRAGSR